MVGAEMTTHHSNMLDCVIQLCNKHKIQCKELVEHQALRREMCDFYAIREFFIKQEQENNVAIQRIRRILELAKDGTHHDNLALESIEIILEARRQAIEQ